jgi:transposase
LKGLPPKKRSSGSQSRNALDRINQLFAIERDLKQLSPQERLKVRDEKSRPLTEDFQEWLKGILPGVLPKSLFGTAVNYGLNQWDKLVRFLEDGRIEIDNNRAERSIKPFVIGRKNFLFCNTPKGATASAVIYSIIESAKENKLNPYAYLNFLFEKLPTSNPEMRERSINSCLGM